MSILPYGAKLMFQEALGGFPGKADIRNPLRYLLMIQEAAFGGFLGKADIRNPLRYLLMIQEAAFGGFLNQIFCTA